MSTTKPTTTHPLINFYDPAIRATDSQNRTRAQILAWNDDRLEYYHDYIQILFPLPEGSPFNPSAPVINRATFDAFRSRPELQDALRTSLERMLKFYGFEFSGNGTGHIVCAANYRSAAKNWVKAFNHNHLRITRIIRSLRVLGLEVEAEEFFKALGSVYGQSGKISVKSIMFWTRAARRPLYIAPEDDEDEGRGCDFLNEFEAQRAAVSGTDRHGGESKAGAEDDGEDGMEGRNSGNGKD